MKCTEQMSKKRFSYLFSLAAASVLAAALAGCGSSSSGDAPVAAAPAAGGGAAVAAPAAVGAPVGTAVITAAAAAPAKTNTAANPAQAFGLIVTAGAAPVTVNSPPVVNFTVIDSTGKFVPSLKLAPSAAADVTADANCSANNATFAMAKWDSTKGAWQSLISRQRLEANVTTPITRYSVVEGTTDPKPSSYTVTGTSVRANPSTAVTDPTTRIVGIMEENAAGGYYTYRFATDVTTSLLLADAVVGKNVANTAASSTAPAYSNKIANNGNLAIKDGKTIHRIGAQICYTDAGKKVMINPTIDFTVNADGSVTPVKSADGKSLALSRQVVDKASCNECHRALVAHGSRVDPNYCVICHNPGSDDYYNNTSVDLKLMAHKLHMGKDLTVANYKVAALVVKATDASGTVTGLGYAQNVKNCVKCHNGTAASATTTSGKTVTADGDNWKKVPSRNACGACHDGIDFAKNTGVTLADAAKGLTTSTTAHIGGAKADDTQCVLCHSAADIPVYHVPVAAVTNANVKTVRTYVASHDGLPAGAFKLEYVISSVTVDSARKVSVGFQIKKDGSAVNFGTYNATTNPNIVPNTVGGPSLRIAYNVTQDGNTSPSDFNAYMSLPGLGIGAPSVSNSAAAPPSTFTAASTANSVWVNTAGVTSSGITWIMTGPDASNIYTITSSLPLPASTTMVEAFMYGAMSQTNLSTFPYAAASVADFSTYKNAAGTTTSYVLTKPGLSLAVDNASKSVTTTGFTARRTIVDNAKCNACHDQLGLFTEATPFHGGGRNDGTTCNVCHSPNAVNKGWSWGFNTFVHAIHGSAKRTVAYTFTKDFSKVGLPPGANVKYCETCHTAGSYDFSATASAAAASKLLYYTVGTGTTAAADSTTSPYIAQTAGTVYGSGFSYSTSTGAVVTTAAAATTLVNSPIAAACFSCHDSAAAKTHQSSDGGGAIYEARSTALLKTENCLFCHGTGKLADIKTMHAK